MTRVDTLNRRNTPLSLLTAWLVVSLLSGCAEIRANFFPEEPARNEAPQTPTQTQGQSLSLLSFGANLRNRSANELNADLELLNRAYAQHRTEENRLRLALFHALTPNGDRARALALLDVPPGDNNGRGRNNPIAAILIPLLQENRRGDENGMVSQQRLREEQKRSEALQQKLDAIRDIEKKMIERAPSSSSSGK